jgi:hypothetical protein
MLEFHRIRPSETAAKTVELYRNPGVNTYGFPSRGVQSRDPLSPL